MDAAALLEQLDQVMRETSPEELPAIVGGLVELEERARLRLRSAVPTVAAGDAADENLDVSEAARRLGVSEVWLYRQKTLPFRVRIGGRVVFSARGLEKWNRSRMGRPS
jgi:predicted DNA-binding transcriptional regulator AlpA